jgi:hypothetical protein
MHFFDSSSKQPEIRDRARRAGPRNGVGSIRAGLGGTAVGVFEQPQTAGETPNPTSLTENIKR